MKVYKPKNVCAMEIRFDVKDGIVHGVEIIGGCEGNRQAVSALVEGLKVEEVIKRIKGIKCGNRNTSCADQLAIALSEYE